MYSCHADVYSYRHLQSELFLPLSSPPSVSQRNMHFFVSVFLWTCLFSIPTLLPSSQTGYWKAALAGGIPGRVIWLWCNVNHIARDFQPATAEVSNKWRLVTTSMSAWIQLDYLFCLTSPQNKCLHNLILVWKVLLRGSMALLQKWKTVSKADV